MSSLWFRVSLLPWSLRCLSTDGLTPTPGSVDTGLGTEGETVCTDVLLRRFLLSPTKTTE